MKQFTGYILMAACIFMLGACSDNEFTERISSVKITEADTQFDAQGGVKTITVEGAGISATSGDEWLTVATDGNTLTLTAQPNPSRESRHTIIEVSALNGDKAVISVSQYGEVFYGDIPEEMTFNNSAQHSYFILHHSGPVNIETTADWLEASVSNDTLYYRVNANTSNTIRHGSISYSLGNYSGTIDIRQGDISIMKGRSFTLSGVDMNATEDTPEENLYLNLFVTIADDGKTATLFIPAKGSRPAARNIKTTVTLNSKDLSIDLHCGSIGMIGNNYAALAAADFFNTGEYTWNSDVTLKFPIYYAEEDSYTGHYGELIDNGSAQGMEISGLLFPLFSQPKFSKDNLRSFYAGCYDCYLKEFIEEDEEEARTLIQKNILGRMKTTHDFRKL